VTVITGRFIAIYSYHQALRAVNNRPYGIAEMGDEGRRGGYHPPGGKTRHCA